MAGKFEEKWDYESLIEGYKYETIDGSKDRDRTCWDFEVVS